jgi:splicing factor U2AF 35 kDa subunit
MAERLARMYGTEEDKVNCPFYAKMGSCRHGDRCDRD